VIVHVGSEIVDQQFLSIPLRAFIDDRIGEIKDKTLHLTGLQVLPKVTRKVEEHGLKEEDETDPLVILVVLESVPFSFDANSRMNHATSVQSIGDGERGVDPAVSVQVTPRNLI